MLLLVSGFVAFGSWPGSERGAQVDQVVLKDAVAKAKPKPVAVRSDAVVVARRAERHQQVAAAKTKATARTHTGSTGPTGTIPAGTPVAQVPAGTSAPQGAPSPATQLQQAPQQTSKTVQNVQDTTRQVGSQVQQGAQNVSTQVNQVVDQVIGGVQTQTDNTVTQVQNATGGLLGH
jgi:gas vesicle protein